MSFYFFLINYLYLIYLNIYMTEKLTLVIYQYNFYFLFIKVKLKLLKGYWIFFALLQLELQDFHSFIVIATY
jgi:hypothetical protein